ncbi:putative molybdate ABC transporter, inner membrane subunit [Ahrensia sp. R2A130]|nr:putative molybdate ABC transporter, inner membrane subunit [Ahrensia sp. R2A130]
MISLSFVFLLVLIPLCWPGILKNKKLRNIRRFLLVAYALGLLSLAGYLFFGSDFEHREELGIVMMLVLATASLQIVLASLLAIAANKARPTETPEALNL